MKAVFLSIETKTEPWVDNAKRTYLKKLKPFLDIQLAAIKSPSMERENADAKKKAEAAKILKFLQPSDLLLIFDESGKTFADSESFAAAFGKLLERSTGRLVFLIGGAYGLHDSVRSRAPASWALGPLTFNHWIAQIVALEQIYRSLTILKRIPYHNR